MGSGEQGEGGSAPRAGGPPVRPVRVAVLVGAAIPRRGCAALVDAAENLELVFEGRPDDHGELAGVEADIVVVGILLRNESGARAIQGLAANGEWCVLALLGPGISPLTALELGAHAWVDGRDPDGSALVEAIDRLVRGEHATRPDGPREVVAISPREREVLRELARGRTDQEIAVSLGISVRTVQSHLDRIREKTKRRRRAELTVLALELGIVPREDAR